MKERGLKTKRERVISLLIYCRRVRLRILVIIDVLTAVTEEFLKLVSVFLRSLSEVCVCVCEVGGLHGVYETLTQAPTVESCSQAEAMAE